MAARLSWGWGISVFVLLIALAAACEENGVSGESFDTVGRADAGVTPLGRDAVDGLSASSPDVADPLACRPEDEVDIDIVCCCDNGVRWAPDCVDGRWTCEHNDNAIAWAGACTDSLSNCRYEPPESDFARYCQQVADEIAALNEEAGEVPDHLLTLDGRLDGSEFDVARYWEALSHIQLEEGWVLDYVYEYTEAWGEPWLYARPADDERPLSPAELSASGIDGRDWREILVLDGSPESYAEYVILLWLAGEFYQYWHSFSFRRVVCTQEALAALGMSIPEPCQDLSADQAEAMVALDITPFAEIDEELARVRVAFFSVWWGLDVRTFLIDPAAPAVDVRYESADPPRVDYNCGVTF